MARVSIPRRLVAAVAVAIAFGVVWTPVAASQSARDPAEERSQSPTLDTLLNRFPIGTKRVAETPRRVAEDPEPVPPPQAVVSPPERSATRSMWLVVLVGTGAVVLLVTLGGVGLHRGRERAATHAPGTSSRTLPEQALAVAGQDIHPTGPLAHTTAAVRDVPIIRSLRQPEAPPAEAEQKHPAEPQPDESALAREQEHHPAVSGGVAAAVIEETLEPASNGDGAHEDAPVSPRRHEEMDYIERNRAAWERWAPGYEAAGRNAWRERDLRWGIWGTPESELGIFEGLEPKEDVVELGCGTATVSAWLARRDARPVAIDFAPTQLRTAAALQHEFRLVFPLVGANAERVPLDDTTFDLAISEYGASLWCDPRRWLPEAHRLLRPGGHLIFFTNGALLMLCTPPDGGPVANRLVRDYFTSYRVEFPEDDAVEFHPTHGDWIRLLRENGFTLVDLIEVRPPPKAEPARYEFASVEWARRWPSEEIWVARKAA